MGKLSLLKSLLVEYGLIWFFFRMLYSLKIKIISKFSALDFIFETRNKGVKRFDIFTIDGKAITAFLKKQAKEQQDKILSDADSAIQGVIKGFSSIELNYGFP